MEIGDVIGALNERTQKRLMKTHKVNTQRKLANHYKRNGGLKILVGELKEAELCRSLTVLDKSELQAVVYGALAFDSKLEALIPKNDGQGPSRKLRGIMQELCGWHDDSFQQATYDALTQMLNRFGIDVEERRLEKLVMGGKPDGKRRAADRKVRLLRMFGD